MKYLESLLLYLPTVVTKSLVEAKVEKQAGEPTAKPEPSTIRTVCLFADVSGFTPLAEELCSMGPNGLENLSTNVNNFATQLVKLVARAGGDILKFAGDALIACWPEVDPNDPNDFKTRVQRAIQCALDAQKRLDQFEVTLPNIRCPANSIEGRSKFLKESETEKMPRRSLRCKIGLGMGDLYIVHLGGQADVVQRERFEYVAFGPALNGAFMSERFARAGEVWVSSEMWSLVCDKFIPLPERSFSWTKLRSRSSSKESNFDIPVGVSMWKEECRVPWRSFDRNVFNKGSVANEIERKLWKYIPNSVIPYLGDQYDETWASELRTVTTVFFDLGLNLQLLSSVEIMNILDKVFYEIQGILLGYEGTVNKFLVDDKGCTLVAVFGLPPLAHENDSLRAVLCAVEVLWMLGNFSLASAAGISTGLAFCGILGHAAGNRREYSVLGDRVNLAARLMVAARNNGMKLLLCEQTRAAISKGSVIEYQSRKLVVKGMRKPITCFLLKGINSLGTQSVPSYHFRHLKNVMLIATRTRSIRQKRKRTYSIFTPGFAGKSEARYLSIADMKNVAENQLSVMNNVHIGGSYNNLKSSFQKPALKDKLGLSVLLESLFKRIKKRSPDQLRNVSASPRLYADKKRSSIDFTSVYVSYRPPNPDIKATEFKILIAKESLSGKVIIQNVIADLVQKKYLSPFLVDKAEYFEFTVCDGPRGPDIGKLATASAIGKNAPVELRLHEFSEIYLKMSYNSQSINRLYPTNKILLSIHSVEYIAARVSFCCNSVLEERGGRFLYLYGGAGTGKTSLVKSCLGRLRVESQIAHFCFVCGNPFEVVQGQSRFSIWRIIFEKFFTEVKSKESTVANQARKRGRHYSIFGKGNKMITSSEKSFNRYIFEALRHSEYYPSFASYEDLLTLNDIIGTSFEPSMKEFEFMNTETNLLSKDRTEVESDNVTKSEELNSAEGDLSSSEFGANLTTASGISKTVSLISAVLGGLAVKCPVVLYVDEAQLIDNSSMLVFKEIAEKWMHKNIFIVLVGRTPIIDCGSFGLRSHSSAVGRVSFRNKFPELGQPIAEDKLLFEPLSSITKKLGNLHCVEKLCLRSAIQNTAEIVWSHFNSKNVPAGLIKHLEQYSRGNPLFIAEALECYKDTEMLRSNKWRRSIRAGTMDLETVSLPLPYLIEAIVSERIDKLTRTQILLLKVAAVIGNSFSVELVIDCYPWDEDKQTLRSEWTKLVQAEFLYETVESEATGLDANKLYTFENGWMGNVIRRRLLSSQKMKLLSKIKQSEDEGQRVNQVSASENVP